MMKTDTTTSSSRRKKQQQLPQQNRLLQQQFFNNTSISSSFCSNSSGGDLSPLPAMTKVEKGMSFFAIELVVYRRGTRHQSVPNMSDTSLMSIKNWYLGVVEELEHTTNWRRVYRKLGIEFIMNLSKVF